MTGRAVILDRDGVITPKLPTDEYILHDDQVKLAEGAAEGLRVLAAAGFRLFIFSNQKCVAKGLITLGEAERLQAGVIALVEAEDVRIEGARLCPHRDEDGCTCRKPKPGMILDLATTHGFDPVTAIVIGDSARDIEAGVAAGCGTCYLIDGSHFRTLLEVARDLVEP
jgi:histidinol-phosphate phosphatase family protein